MTTFNQCTHQPLLGTVGPAISLHIDDNATPYAAHTPAPIPLHWQDAVEEQLGADDAMGVLEKVPFGEPSSWCHRMVLARKADGTLRRTVDHPIMGFGYEGTLVEDDRFSGLTWP